MWTYNSQKMRIVHITMSSDDDDEDYEYAETETTGSVSAIQMGTQDDETNDDEDEEGEVTPFINPREDLIGAIEQIQQRLTVVDNTLIITKSLMNNLQDDFERLQATVDVIQEEEEAPTHQPRVRYYAVARGIQNPPNSGRFISGIYTDVNAYRAAYEGGWNAVHRSFSSRLLAEQWMEEELPRIRQEHEERTSPEGIFSTRWYSVWSVELPWHRIVHTDEEARLLVEGHSDRRRQHHRTYVQAVAHATAQRTARDV